MEKISNLAKKASELKDVVSVSKGTELIYKFQLSEKLSTDAQKKLRKSLRNKFIAQCYRCVNAKVNNNFLLKGVTTDKQVIEDTIKMYKDTYILNDFSFTPFTRLKNESDIERIQIVLEVMKKFISKK